MNKEIYSQHEEKIPLSVSEVLVAGNRGPCGGVNMTLDAVDQVLEIVDGRENVYTNWDPIHNTPEVRRLSERGLINIRNDWEKIPNGSILVFSAHGVPSQANEISIQKKLHIIDTTCPLVTRVHNLAKKAEAEGKHIVYEGKSGHPETVGVMGEISSENISLIENPGDVEKLSLPEEKDTIVFSQTTLAIDEIKDSQIALKTKFPNIEIPNRWDICYATDNRQLAVEDLLDNHRIDFLLVVGSGHSHNSQELKKKGDKRDIVSVLIDDVNQIRRPWFLGSVNTVGLTSGASVLDNYTEGVLDWFRNEGVSINYLPQIVDEKTRTFRLPQEQIDSLKNRWNN